MDSIWFEDFINPGQRHNLFAVINQPDNIGLMYGLIYDAIMEHPAYVVFSAGDPIHKCSVLGSMIAYYEGLEQYEKCANLLKIKKTILQEDANIKS
jgi:hypothetical protein